MPFTISNKIKYAVGFLFLIAASLVSTNMCMYYLGEPKCPKSLLK